MHGHAALAIKGKNLLRFVTCGAKDGGEAALFDRLLQGAHPVSGDDLAALERTSARSGPGNDVTCRYFSTQRRIFAGADLPGGEQYISSLAMAASRADLAILLVDASKGLTVEDRRQAAIAGIMGIRHIVIAVDKLDLLDWDQGAFETIAASFRTFAGPLGFRSLVAIPLSARLGDNVTARSRNTPWYAGPALIEQLDTVELDSDTAQKPFRLPVQNVIRSDTGSLYEGRLASGMLELRQPVMVVSSGRKSTLRRILVDGREQQKAVAGDAVAIALADEIGIEPGDMLAPPHAQPEMADQFAAHLIWVSQTPLLPGRSYLLEIGASRGTASVTTIKYLLAVDSLEHQAARTLGLNEIGICNLATISPIALDPFADNRATGSFRLIDRYTNATVALGVVDFALRRGTNIHEHKLAVSKKTRAGLKGQKPAILWFTGLSGSGKSTIANLLEAKLTTTGRHAYLLDGDNIRHGLNNDLGFTEADRVENIRRVGEVAKLFVDAGMVVLCAFISPFRAERAVVRALVGEGEFLEIFVDAPLEICESRDPKGLYAKSRAGKLPNFTGIDSPYEQPENPDLVLNTAITSADALAERVLAFLSAHGYLQPPGQDSPRP